MFAKVVLPLPFDALYTYSIPPEMEESVFFGIRVSVPLGKRRINGFVVEISNEADVGDFEIKPIARVIDKSPVFSKELYDLAIWMKGMYFSSVGENLSMMIPSGKRDSDVPSFSSSASFSRIKKLTQDQERAVGILNDNPTDTYYIYGVTGAGKSEVYLRRAERVIKEGKQVLYLVPEITLSNQISSDVYERFAGRVAILHSALTPSQRLSSWHKIASGDVDIVIGARSCVFAPFKNLGLIIIDEEHDGSYKSGNTPRYHARQVAQYRARKSNCQLIMGSATPSLEAWRLILEQKIKSIVMSNRIGEGKFPRVSVVNTLKENRNISHELEVAIRKTLDDGKGVILFLNRRGYSYNYVCSSCGHVVTCPNCTVSLTYHKRTNRLTCHTCGYSQPLVKICPECGSVSLEPRGYGTENVEQEVRALFPRARVARLDTDVVSGDKNASREIIEAFKNGEIDILLGTQMIAKGLNFPLVSLVGVLNADSMLSLPDFRAAERAFGLIHQVAGRVGRYRDDGWVIIQTTQPQHPAIQYAAINDLESFYRTELEDRRLTLFPPYSRLINLTIRGKREDKVISAIDSLDELAKNLKKNYSGVDVFSASPCIIEKQSQNYRYHILLRGTNPSVLLSFAGALLSSFSVPSGLYLEIDVDPASLL